MWHKSVRAVNKKVSLLRFATVQQVLTTEKERGFHVALALEFGEYVLAFLSIDNVFQVSVFNLISIASLMFPVATMG